MEIILLIETVLMIEIKEVTVIIREEAIKETMVFRIIEEIGREIKDLEIKN